MINMEWLVGHVRIEISSLLYHFLREDKSNSIKVKVIGKRKREFGLQKIQKIKELQKYPIQNLQKDVKCSQHLN